MRGLVPGIHVFANQSKTWMVGTSPAMTKNYFLLPLGDQPTGASSKPSKEKPGAIVQPTSVQSPKLSAACQARAGAP